MPHELEQLANGQTAFVSARLSAWHRLGTLTDDCMTAEDMTAPRGEHCVHPADRAATQRAAVAGGEPR